VLTSGAGSRSISSWELRWSFSITCIGAGLLVPWLQGTIAIGGSAVFSVRQGIVDIDNGRMR